jgi:hypothetical protein
MKNAWRNAVFESEQCGNESCWGENGFPHNLAKPEFIGKRCSQLFLRSHEKPTRFLFESSINLGHLCDLVTRNSVDTLRFW